MIWTLELKRNRQTNNSKKWAFHLAEPGREPCFQTDKVLTEAICLVSKACWAVPKKLCYRSIPPPWWRAEGMKKIGKGETGKDICAGQAASVKHPLGLTWQTVQVMHSVSGDKIITNGSGIHFGPPARSESIEADHWHVPVSRVTDNPLWLSKSQGLGKDTESRGVLPSISFKILNSLAVPLGGCP